MATQGLHLILLIFFNHLICLLGRKQGAGFIYNGFLQAQADLHLDGAAKILSPDGLLQLTNASTQQMGHAFFKHPFDSSEKNFSFSTHFVCALVPKPGAEGGRQGGRDRHLQGRTARLPCRLPPELPQGAGRGRLEARRRLVQGEGRRLIAKPFAPQERGG